MQGYILIEILGVSPEGKMMVQLKTGGIVSPMDTMVALTTVQHGLFSEAMRNNKEVEKDEGLPPINSSELELGDSLPLKNSNPE